MASIDITEPHRPRGPGVMYAALALAMAVLIAIVALVTNQPPPPTIAEFAPQAQEQITEAPDEQSSEFGTGDGDCGPGQACEGFRDPDGPGTTPGPRETIIVSRVNRCIGDPPRQIEDPQSPPCVPYWQGDNGGATSPGVTADTINIVTPEGDYYTTSTPAYANFFNSRFEFYGRKIRIQLLESGAGIDQTAQEASAIEAKEKDAFASLTQIAFGGNHYARALAERKIIYSGVPPLFGERELAANRPYMWQYPMDRVSMFDTMGDWACAKLAGRPARYADGGLSSETRSFGIVVNIGRDVPDIAKPIKDRLRGCGATVADEQEYDPLQGTSLAAQVMLRMADRGVTSIFCLCVNQGWNDLATAASSHRYYPEWLNSSYWNLDLTLKPYDNPPDQTANVFGLSFVPMATMLENDPIVWAAREGGAPKDQFENGATSRAVHQWFYRSLLLIASGIQMAGPNLTPETFERGLQRAVFPNPHHPNMAGSVGFARGPHSMTVDAAEFWWSNSDRGPYDETAPGIVCYVDGGRRSRAGQWTGTDEDFFQRPCQSSARAPGR